MILVRMLFQAKPGRAADLVANIKETVAAAQSAAMVARSVRIFTDLSGPMDTVVEEVQYDSFDAFMQDRATVVASPELKAIMGRRLDMIEGGHREYYRVEFEQ